jgi:aquaporin Z|uniref:Major intrinsic protein n=1 Tax=viral metagenome TaxID=1070528 RepID=A0A6C0K7D7_9ZZZZ
MNTLPFLVEFLGTFLLLISILATGNAFIIGATLALIILLVGGISGAHVNPAVSLAMFIKSAITGAEFGGYVVSQLLGATAAFYAYKALA